MKSSGLCEKILKLVKKIKDKRMNLITFIMKC